MKNNQKGITLVALVITIIVLLILAGVTIAALSGDNGILTRASQSKQNDEIGTAKDTINLAANQAIQEYYNRMYVDTTATAIGGSVAENNKQTTVKNFVIEAVKATVDATDTTLYKGKVGNASVEIKTTTTGSEPNITTTVTLKVISSDGKANATGSIDTYGSVTWNQTTR